jgi:hypothetical protein
MILDSEAPTGYPVPSRRILRRKDVGTTYIQLCDVKRGIIVNHSRVHAISNESMGLELPECNSMGEIIRGVDHGTRPQCLANNDHHYSWKCHEVSGRYTLTDSRSSPIIEIYGWNLKEGLK